MRRQYFAWTWLVLSIVLTVYGGYSLIYNHINNKGLSILGLVFFIVGMVLLATYFVLLIISIFQKKKVTPPTELVEVEEKVEEPKEEIKVEEKVEPATKSSPRKEYSYTPSKKSSSSRYDVETSYVRKVGYGPVLRVTGNEILDMRSNTYYRIEGDMVKQVGSGPVYEISGNRIRLAFGGYLYEISGDSVNKTFGGYYASISGGYLQVHDLSEKYEISSSLSMKQKLTIVALLFGLY